MAANGSAEWPSSQGPRVCHLEAWMRGGERVQQRGRRLRRRAAPPSRINSIKKKKPHKSAPRHCHVIRRIPRRRAAPLGCEAARSDHTRSTGAAAARLGRGAVDEEVDAGRRDARGSDELLDEPAEAGLGCGSIVASEREVPNMFAIPV